MDNTQLELIKSYNLCIVHIRTAYHLNLSIDISKLRGIYLRETYASVIMKKDKRGYQIDVYPNGKLIIYKETNTTAIITLIEEFIEQFNIPYIGTLDDKNLTIDGLRCEGALLYDININMIPYNLCILSRRYDRIYYNQALNNANAYIGHNGIIINSSSYNNTIYICKHIYTTFPAVLVVLNHMDNSFFSMIPYDVIGYILKYIFLINTY